MRDDFLSDAEASFYHLIKDMMGEYLTICPKVALSNIFYIPRTHEKYQVYLNKIDRKNVDFLICEPKTMRPRFAIELDDSSHKRDDRIERDEFVDVVFKTVGLPLVRVPVRVAYDTRELGERFKSALGENTMVHTKAEPVQLSSPDATPYCPNCGERMVLREARRGAKAGIKFYGCPNYPRCKAIIPSN